MKLRIKKTTVSEQFIGLAYACIGLIGFTLAQFDLFILRIVPRCTLKKLTGLPCPSCGATRSGIFLSRFNPLDSLLENPLYFFLYCALFFYGINALFGAVFKMNLSLSYRHVPKKTTLILIALIIAANWIYLIIRSNWS